LLPFCSRLRIQIRTYCWRFALIVGFPACFCKFIENLLVERFIYIVQNGDLEGPLIIHKRLPKDLSSPRSLLLFNIYLRNIGRYLHSNSYILQYADDIVLFFLMNLFPRRGTPSSSPLNQSANSLILSVLSLSKSKSIIFSRSLKSPDHFVPFTIEKTRIPVVDQVKFLGVTLDRKLNSVSFLKSLLTKDFRIANIVTSFSGM